MQINDKPITDPMDLLRLAFIGTAIEPHLPKLDETLRADPTRIACKLAVSHAERVEEGIL